MIDDERRSRWERARRLGARREPRPLLELRDTVFWDAPGRETISFGVATLADAAGIEVAGRHLGGQDAPRRAARRPVSPPAIRDGACRPSCVLLAGLRPAQAVGTRQAELAGDRLQRGDDVRDVLVELEPEQLRARVDLVPVDAGRERRLLQLLPHGLRLQALEPGRAGRARRRG